MAKNTTKDTVQRRLSTPGLGEDADAALIAKGIKQPTNPNVTFQHVDASGPGPAKLVPNPDWTGKKSLSEQNQKKARNPYLKSYSPGL
jgi:hypothetical protein